jgi:hypothetical protein
MTAIKAVLMGPQRLAPIVDRALDLLQVGGTVALITAGWQEREAEDRELKQALGGRDAVNLMLHSRGEAVFHDDNELFTSHRAKQDTLRRLQELYRRRLGHAMAAAIQMQGLEQNATVAPRELISTQTASAIDAVRRLDDEHARASAEVEAAFAEKFQPRSRAAVQKHRRAIDQTLARCSAVAIAGGHVAVLLNKLRLFGLEEELLRLPLVAWSAGAMVVTERVVLFHDSPPQGRGNAEVLGPGLGLCPGIIALPHARRRLLLDDSRRIALFARRFAGATCVTLDEECTMAWCPDAAAGTWRAGGPTRELTADGACMAMATEAATEVS